MTNTEIPARTTGPARPASHRPTRSVRSTTASARDRGARLLATLFLAPTVVGIVVFTVVPIVGSVVLSLFHWNVIDDPRFAGARQLP